MMLDVQNNRKLTEIKTMRKNFFQTMKPGFHNVKPTIKKNPTGCWCEQNAEHIPVLKEEAQKANVRTASHVSRPDGEG